MRGVRGDRTEPSGWERYVLMYRLFNMVLAAGRDESPYVDQASVHNDVKTLYRAGQGKVGTVSLPL